MTHPGGRPTDLNRPVCTQPDGTTITVADRIVTAIKNGTPLAGAASTAGITAATMYEWMRQGARIERQLAANPNTELTDHDRQLSEFSYNVSAAIGDYHMRANATLDSLAFGGTEVVTITQKVRVNDDGTEEPIEQTTKTERLGPSADVLKWRLRTHFPDLYSERVELSGPGGDPIPVEVRAKMLVESIVKFKADRGEVIDLPEIAHADQA